MSLFRKVSEFFRDKKRDEFCAHLRSLGIDAQLAPRSLREEKLERGSLGVIDISEGPIRWVNILKGAPNLEGNAAYYADFGVPDPKLEAGFPKVGIRSAKVKTTSFFGKVVDIDWSGRDYSLGIIVRLQNDLSLKKLATENKHVDV